MKLTKITITLLIALVSISTYAIYNQVKVSKQKHEIHSLSSQIDDLEDDKHEMEEKVEELENKVNDLEDDLSEVQHFDEDASSSGYSNSGATSFTGSAYETKIDGDFEGWDGDTIFKMADGSVWQQDSYDYTYHYSYMPDVLIYNKNGSTYMQVEGVDDPIQVKRLR